MRRRLPPKLSSGDMVRVIAPSHSISILSDTVRQEATAKLEALGLRVTFGARVTEINEFNSSSIESRIQDLHEAFLDTEVKAIFAVIGGYNVNQLLPHINWSIIRKNPKILLGYSDTTALQNAIFAQTGLVTYSGPAYSTFGQQSHFEYTLNYVRECLMADQPYEIKPSDEWLDDQWYLGGRRTPIQSTGWKTVAPGRASGVALGGNLSTFRLLQGTTFFPKISKSILFLEDDEDSDYAEFDRNFEALTQHPDFKYVQAIIIGRFQKNSQVTVDHLKRLWSLRANRLHIPCVVNVDFGHTNPMFTIPIGGQIALSAEMDSATIKILVH